MSKSNFTNKIDVLHSYIMSEITDIETSDDEAKVITFIAVEKYFQSVIATVLISSSIRKEFNLHIRSWKYPSHKFEPIKGIYSLEDLRIEEKIINLRGEYLQLVKDLHESDMTRSMSQVIVLDTDRFVLHHHGFNKVIKWTPFDAISPKMKKVVDVLRSVAQ